MTVIIRRNITDEFGNVIEEVTYQSISHPISLEERKKAEDLDKFLNKKMAEVKLDFEVRGLLEKKQGDIERWYRLGEYLASFIDDSSIIPPEDRAQDRYIWEALWHHAPEGVRPGPPNSNTGTSRDHFRLCYELSKIPYGIAIRFTWSEWVNFLETPAVNEESRITNWVWRHLPGVNRKALRSLTQVLRSHFRKRDLSVLTDEELSIEIEYAWSLVPDKLREIKF